MEISTFLPALFMLRYVEISMYPAMKHMARYMEISMYLALSRRLYLHGVPELTERFTSITDKFTKRFQSWQN